MTKIKYERGSEWRKWDLHTHTKGTQKNDNFTSLSFDKFCKKMLLEAIDNQIQVIGITDYFNLDNYLKLKSYIQEIDKNNDFETQQKEEIKDILLVPNVELRMLPSTDSGKLVNIHCLFNPENNFVESLENDFASLHDSGGNKMNRQGIISLGKSLDPMISDNDVAYKKGIDNFHVDISSLSKLFKKNSKLSENTIIAVSNSNQDGASGLQKHYELFENNDSSLDSVRKNIYELSQVIFSGNPNDRLFFLGLKSGCDKELVIHNCGSLKPCIHGSDAHKETELFKPHKNRYCWIKADPTFEGLKQIICEPEERVLIQPNKPEEKSGYQVIDSIEINNNLCNQKIMFNPNLNTIIGGRSTGKSKLLQVLVNKINSEELKNDENFNNSIDFIDKLSVNAKVIWKDKEENKNRDIDFFPQSYMYKIANTESRKDELVENIIKEKDADKNLFRYESFCNDNKLKIQRKIDDLFDLLKKQSSISNSLKEKGDVDGVKKEIEIINSKLSEIKVDKNFNEEEQSQFKTNQSLLTQNNIDIEKFQNDISKIEELKQTEIVNQSISYKIAGVSEENQKLISIEFEHLSKEVSQKWKKYLDEQIERVYQNIKDKKQSSIEIQESENFKLGKKHLYGNLQYKDYSKKLSQEQLKLDEINQIQKELTFIKKEINVLKKEILNLHLKFKESSEDLRNKINQSFDDISIEVSAVFKKASCEALLTESINRKGYSRKNYIEKFINEYESDTLKIIKEFINKMSRYEIELKGYQDHQTLTKRVLTENWFSVSYNMTYQNDTFDLMSDGKKAFVILKLLLEVSDKKSPILIDQPEDSLDNRAIYNELVQYIKKKKKERQIILVTHNANVVVNADAEEVIVANQHGEDSKNTNDIKFEYVSGSLENTFPKNKSIPTILHSQGIREHVCEILEGGTEAFKRREDKYGIK